MADARPIRVCAIVFSYYPADPRPRREAEALIDAGIEVDVVCLREDGEAPRETVHGVQVIRVPLQRRRGNKLRYIFEYAIFIVRAFMIVTGGYLRRRYDVVHVHTMPDILVLSALIPRLAGAKVIIDLHDPMPEIFMTKYDMEKGHRLIRVLRALERFSIGFANHAITPNAAFRRLFLSRSCPPDKMTVLMNTPDPKIFEVPPESTGVQPPHKGRFVMMYHGTVVERHGLATALEAVHKLRPDWPELQFDVYGSGDYVQSFQQCVEDLLLQEAVHYHGHVPLERIAADIEHADVGVIPNLRSDFTELNLPTRIFEYLSKGKPVIAPNTEGIRDYFDQDSIFFFEPGDVNSLAAAISAVAADSAHTAAVVERGEEMYRVHHWDLEKQTLIDLVRSLARSGGS